jgi:hypothetical protein
MKTTRAVNPSNIRPFCAWPSSALLLASRLTGFGQSTLQFTATTYTISESTGSVILPVQHYGDLAEAGRCSSRPVGFSGKGDTPATVSSWATWR